MNGISFIIITNGKKYDTTLESIASIIKNVDGKIPYEIILSGNIKKFKIPNIKFKNIPEMAKIGNLSAMRNQGADISIYDILFFLDDDVVLDDLWYDNFKKYSDNNEFDVYATKLLLPNGDRCWDRAVVFKSYQSMVNYNHNKYDQNLYQTGTYMIIKRDVYMKLKFDETILYYGGKVHNEGDIAENEDVDFSRRLYNAGYCIDFDPNNAVHHIDHTLVQINNVVVKKTEEFNENTLDRGSFWTRYEDIVFMYQQHLGRLPDQDGLARYLFDNKLSSNEINHILSTSQEHYDYINK